MTVYDVSAPRRPQLISRLDIEGNYVDSRMIGDVVYLVSSHQFHLPPPEIVPGRPAPDKPDPGERLAGGLGGRSGGQHPALARAESAMARAGCTRRASSIGNGLAIRCWTWPCRTTPLSDAAGNSIDAGLLSSAEATYRPLGGQDDQLVSITAFDVGAAVPAIVASSSAPIGWASTVYVSPQSLYVVTADWSSGQPSSQIYKFALRPEEGQIPLVATGQVPGQVLNAFSLDEQGSYLRIVTQSGWRADAESALYVLDQVGEKLAAVGQIEDLAPGEQLYSVRFLGDRAFVVTFGPDGGNWVDPLFTIDLSDPAAPRVEGQLEIPGFSNYLQMIDGEFLIGLGRNADETNGRQLEPQVSLFDVSDFADPLLADRVSFGDASSWSEAFFNHHAISYFPDQKMLAVPLDTWTPAAVVVDEAGNPILARHVGTVTPRRCPGGSRSCGSSASTRRGKSPGRACWERSNTTASILRSLRIGEQLFSISADTVQAHNIFDPGEKLGELYFGPRATDDWFSVDRTQPRQRPGRAGQRPDRVRRRRRLDHFVGRAAGSGRRRDGQRRRPHAAVHARPGLLGTGVLHVHDHRSRRGDRRGRRHGRRQ